MTTIYHNTKAYLEKGRFAEAFAVSKERFVAVGSFGQLATLYPDAERVDLGGKTVIPGFNDSHMHLMMVGQNLLRPNIASCRSIDEMIALCRDFIEKNPEMTAGGLHAMGWNQDLFKGDNRMPTREDMDKISTEIPIVLERICGHILVTNTLVIQKLGLSAETPQFEGGEFKLGEDNYPNGIFCENACGYALSLIPPFTREQKASCLAAAIEYAVSRGLTSVQSNDIHISSEGDENLDILREMDGAGKLALRYHCQICFDSPELFEQYIKEGFFAGERKPSDKLTIGPLKMFRDGSLGARTALMRNDYADEAGNRGIEAASPEVMGAFCKAAAEGGVQVVTHVIGDEAIERTVSDYEAVCPPGENPLRHSLVHCQITDLPMLERIVRDKLLIQYQPIFLEYDLHIVAQRAGEALAKTSYAFETARKLGADISFGTDSPVEDCNPFLNCYCAVTRSDYEGYPEGGYCPDERMDISDVIDAYTLGSARCQFAEEYKGRLKEGYLADFVVLKEDIFTVCPQDIKGILPEATFVGGVKVYSEK